MQQELLENLSFSGRSGIRYICMKGRTGDSARLERKYDAHKKLKFTQNTFTLLEKFLILLQRNPCQKMVIINKQSLMQCVLATRATLLVCQMTYSYTWAHFSSQGIFAGFGTKAGSCPFPIVEGKPPPFGFDIGFGFVRDIYNPRYQHNQVSLSLMVITSFEQWLDTNSLII